jgi:hypothetical protein
MNTKFSHVSPFKWSSCIAAALAVVALQSGMTHAATPTSSAGTVVVCCPESAQTYADNTVLQRRLSWHADPQRLVASISFSNADYVSDTESRHAETFTFSLPGVKYDPKTEIFFISSAHNPRIPVAVVHRQLLGKSIQLLPSASLEVMKNSGFVTVRLVAGQN